MEYLRSCTIRRLVLFLSFFALFSFVAVPAALAHPLGNFTINHYSRLEIAPDELRLRYVLDMAEIPTFQEKQVIDRNGDGRIDDAEREQYLATITDSLAHNLKLKATGQSVPLQLVPGSATLEFPQGQGGLDTLRLTMWFTASLAIENGQRVTITYEDDNYSERIGWREIVAQANDQLSLAANVPSRDVSNELRTYPQDMLSQPLDERAATIAVAFGGAALAPSAPQLATSSQFGALDRTKDAFAELVATRDLSWQVILLSLGAALLLGALHAFSPGHGKTIVGAYLVGAKGTAKHALILGLVVTATHTIGVYALGLVTLFASRYIVPEVLYPWLGVISGALVALIGIRLFMSRLFSMRGQPAAHSHDHEHIHTHIHADGTTHSHDEDDELEHARTHIPAVLQDAPLTWRNLLYLGISGGLLPCPSALVVMLSAIALGRVVFGLVLIVFFSIGLAGVLTLTGIILLYFGRIAGRLFQAGTRGGRILRALPVASAFVVTILGVGIAAEALVQAGIVR